MVKLNLLFKMRFNIAHGLVTTAQNAPNALRGPAGVPWREAASIMLVSPTPPPPPPGGGGEAVNVSGPGPGSAKKQPHFLVTKRSKQSGSFSNILCFPGGNACAADSDKLWSPRFGEIYGYDIEKGDREGEGDGIAFIGSTGEIPKIYRNRNSIPSMKAVGPSDFKSIPKAISLRITAIRETFEETGVLLCRMNDAKRDYGKGLGRDSKYGVGYEANVVTFEDPKELTRWQELIRRNPKAFMAMCDEIGCMPDVNALVEWNDWLTPNCFGMTRYDTIFYMALLPQSYPLYLCPQEVESASWLTADKVLKDCEQKESKMITPQIYELTRLRKSSLSVLSQLMKVRLRLGIERWCPAYIRAKDGYLSVFPGDDLYPAHIKIEVFEPIQSLDSTLDELRETSFRQHRIEYRSEFDFRIVIKNYKEKAGHVYLD